MQKIVFVGIILIIGLFSLQFTLAPLYSDYFAKNESASQIANPTLKPVSYIQRNCRIIYISPQDTVIEIIVPQDYQL